MDGGGGGGVGGSLIKVGGGTLTLTGANTYTGETTISGGIVQLGTGGATGSLIGPVIDNSSLIVDRSATLVLAGPISGLGSVTQAGPGTVILPGTNSYSGATNVTAGTLQVDGLLTQSAVTVFSGATLSGQGTIAQDVTVENGGTLAPGPGAQTLTVGNLTLNQNSILDYSLSTPGVVGLGVNSLVDVNGNLTLDGILNVGNGGSFGAGAYRLLNYTGVLDDETLHLGILPAGFTGSVTTGVGGQVNLVVSSTASVSQFWDGTNTVFDRVVHGGDGVWDNSATNFTDGAVTVNQAWQNGVAIFSAAAGTVTLGTDIAFQGLQFTISGYAIVGSGAFTLVPTGTALISTDSGVTATVTAPVTGTGGIDKTGGGELVLAGVNTYTGGTIVSGGILSIAADGNLGNAAGGVELNGGELLTSANLTSARTVTLAASLNGPNTVAAAANTVGTYTGLFVGSGGLTVGDPVNVGTVVLENLNNSYTGGTTVAGGIVSVGLDGDLGEVSGGIHLNAGEVLTTGNGFLSFRPVDLMIGGGILAASAGGVGDFQGNITGSGTLNVGDALNTGTVEFSGTNTYTGSTTIGAGATLKAISVGSLSAGSSMTVTGTLDLEASNEVASLAGTGLVVNNGVGTATLTTGGNLSSTVFSGVLSDGTGVLGLTKVGGGQLTLTWADTYTGGTTISAGILGIGDGGATGSIVGNVLDNGQVIFNRSDLVTFGGVVSGTGSLVKEGGGTLVLTGANAYTGGTFIESGTLQIGDGGTTGSIVGPVVANGALVYDLNTPVTFAGLISGPGGLIVNAAGLTLTADNTYTGDAVIPVGGHLQLGNGGATGSIVGDVVNQGTLLVSRSNGSVLSGNISGAGVLEQLGPGTLTLTGTNSYSGGTVILGGVLSVDRDAELGLVAPGLGGIIISGGELLTTSPGFTSARAIELSVGTDVMAATSGTLATYTGVISGSSALVVGEASSDNAGTIVLSNLGNSYLGGRLLMAGPP